MPKTRLWPMSTCSARWAAINRAKLLWCRTKSLMWWFNTRQKTGIGKMKKQFFFICLLMPVFCLLAACGFHPVYGGSTAKGPVAEQLNQVAIDNIADRQGQLLRNDL